MQLRDYQDTLSTQAAEKLSQLGMCYLSMEVRTGKTLTAIAAAEKYAITNGKFGKIGFLTKKKAIEDICNQYESYNPNLSELVIINYESVHLIYENLEGIDVLILDEAHKLGAYPKMSGVTKKVRKVLDMASNTDCRVIFLSGTPSPESYSQLFHQFAVSKRFNPFREFPSFYKWANKYVNKKQKYVGHGNPINDYSDAHKGLIDEKLEDYFISYTQSQAGFDIHVEEEVLTVPMHKTTLKVIRMLLKDLVVVGKEQTIVADTGVKLQSKVHQLYSGTIKFDDGSTKVIDYSKAYYIEHKFQHKKIAIFYKFKAEYDLLKSVFTNHTSEPTEFNESNDLVFLGQIQSVREGINLSTADYLIMYNIDFSAVSYWQGRDRLSTKDRVNENKVYWIFAEGGIEHRIYKAVMSKRDYTLSFFVKEYNVDKKRFKKDDGTTDTKED